MSVMHAQNGALRPHYPFYSLDRTPSSPRLPATPFFPRSPYSSRIAEPLIRQDRDESMAQTPPRSPSAVPPDPPSVVDPARENNRARFELELEFVQALANPFYLHSLAQQGVLHQPAFINYLAYLLYWKEKDYARFIQYPHALHHLELLQNAQFRAEVGKDDLREALNQKQFDHWRTWRDPKHLSAPSAAATQTSLGKVAVADGLPADGETSTGE